MAVVVKNPPDAAARRSLNRLAVDSWAGVAYLFGSLGLIFYVVPTVWEAVVGSWLAPAIGAPGNMALLVVADLAVAIGLAVLAGRLLGTEPTHGLKAGILVGAVEVLVAAGITSAVGTALQNSEWGAANPAPALAVTAVLGVALLAAAVVPFLMGTFDRWLIAFEDQGWFSLAGYKRTQGIRVRRGTIVAILVMAGCGIFTLMAHDTLKTGPVHWQYHVPFTADRYVILLPHLQFTLPIILVALSLWLAWRVVNFPAFADFLIATEAEMNKVSWTSRRHLIQDTVVVLVTVVLLTAFLFAADRTWEWLLQRVGVLQLPAAAQKAGQDEIKW